MVESPFVTNVGDVGVAKSGNTGRIHVGGSAHAATADYFRGRFDGVPDDLDAFSIGPSIRLGFDLFRESGYKAALVIGSANNFWTEEVLPAESDIDAWYESNNFVGLAADLGNDVTAGLTYTVYTSPNNVFGTSHELALAAKYGGEVLGLSLNPQIKVAMPVDDGDGVFAQLKATPLSFDVDIGARDVNLSLPVTLGVGFADYYGDRTDTTGYVDVGLQASMPLGLPSDYGQWSLNAGFDVLAREGDLRDADPAVAGDDTVIYIGQVSVSFAY